MAGFPWLIREASAWAWRMSGCMFPWRRFAASSILLERRVSSEGASGGAMVFFWVGSFRFFVLLGLRL